MKIKHLLIAGLALAPLFAAGNAQADQRYCREYTKNVRINGQLQSGYGTACMQPDGSWELVTFNGNDNMYDEIRQQADYGTGRLIRVEQRPPQYWYPAYTPAYYRPYYGRPYPPQTVISFNWGDNDRRDWSHHDRNYRDWDRHDDNHDHQWNHHGRH